MTRYSLDLSKTSNKILGLDISTSCTGYAILDVDLGCCVEIGFFQLDKFDNFFDKCDSFRKGLSELSKDHMTICDIFIEENLHISTWHVVCQDNQHFGKI